MDKITRPFGWMFVLFRSFFFQRDIKTTTIFKFCWNALKLSWNFFLTIAIYFSFSHLTCYVLSFMTVYLLNLISCISRYHSDISWRKRSSLNWVCFCLHCDLSVLEYNSIVKFWLIEWSINLSLIWGTFLRSHQTTVICSDFLM